MSVNVAIIPDKVTPGDIELVKTFFQDELFNLVSIPDIYYDNEGYESVLIPELLKIYGDKHLIIIKDTSHTLLSSDQIAKFVNEAISIPNIDLYYLSRWNDQCQMSRQIKGHDNFIRTFSPRGVQAIMFYPTSNNKLIKSQNDMDDYINKLIMEGKLIAISNQSVIFTYNVYKYGDNNSFFERFNICSRKNPTKEVNNVNRYLYIGGILFLIFLIAWGMRRMGPNNTDTTKSDKYSTILEFLPFEFSMKNEETII